MILAASSTVPISGSTIVAAIAFTPSLVPHDHGTLYTSRTSMRLKRRKPARLLTKRALETDSRRYGADERKQAQIAETSVGDDAVFVDLFARPLRSGGGKRSVLEHHDYVASQLCRVDEPLIDSRC